MNWRFFSRQSGYWLGTVRYTNKCCRKNRIAYVTIDTVYRDNYCHFIFLSFYCCCVWMPLRCLAIIILSWFAKRIIGIMWTLNTHCKKASIIIRNEQANLPELLLIIQKKAAAHGSYQFYRLYVCNKRAAIKWRHWSRMCRKFQYIQYKEGGTKLEK